MRGVEKYPKLREFALDTLLLAACSIIEFCYFPLRMKCNMKVHFARKICVRSLINPIYHLLNYP